MKRVSFLLFFILCSLSLYAISYESLFINFSNDKNITFVGSLPGYYTGTDDYETIVFFKKEFSYDFDIYYFKIINSTINKYIKIQELYNSDGLSTIESTIFKKYNSVDMLGFCTDNNQNGKMELYLNRNLWNTRPLIFEKVFVDFHRYKRKRLCY